LGELVLEQDHVVEVFGGCQQEPHPIDARRCGQDPGVEI